MIVGIVFNQKRRIYHVKDDEVFVPCYITEHNKVKKMDKDNAYFESFIKIKHLIFSPLSIKLDNTTLLGERLNKSSIYSLRDSIYQTEESTKELRDIKNQMIETLDEAELKLLRDNIKGSYYFKEIPLSYCHESPTDKRLMMQ